MRKINNGQVARSVRFDIATDKNEEFHRIFRNDVLPMMKKQDGFRDELLLVDDQPLNLSALEAVLEPLGENSVSSNSGIEALRQLRHRDFAVILHVII